MPTLVCLSLLLLLLSATHSAQQPAVETNLSGDYVVRFSANGVPQEMLFERATHIQPEVRVLVESQSDGSFLYRYTVANHGGRQELHSFAVTGVTGASLSSSPVEWEGDIVLTRSRAYWLRLSKSGKRGIAPGSSVDGFRLTGRTLPGPTTAECRGATSVPRIQPTVPESALQQLRKLMERDFVAVPTIGPVIAGFGPSEPELTTAVFLARVKVHFAVALIRAEHPASEGLLRAIDDAISAAERGVDLNPSLPTVEALALRATASPRLMELNDALLTNIEHLRKASR